MFENEYDTSDIFEMLDDVCEKSDKMTDEELAYEIKEIYSLCYGGLTGKNFWFISHMRSEFLIEKRVISYCNKNNISLYDYNGPLPYVAIKPMNYEKNC